MVLEFHKPRMMSWPPERAKARAEDVSRLPIAAIILPKKLLVLPGTTADNKARRLGSCAHIKKHRMLIALVHDAYAKGGRSSASWNAAVDSNSP